MRFHRRIVDATRWTRQGWAVAVSSIALSLLSHGLTKQDRLAHDAQMVMSPATSSIIVTQRERFDTTIQSLESLLSTIPADARLIYVDAGSPKSVARDLTRAAAEHNFLLLRADRFLAPNEARNLAVPYVTTDFVAFVDNDLLFEPGWLERLTACAQETGAWLVSPIIAQQGKHGLVMHMVGGKCEIIEDQGRRRFRENHNAMGRSIDDVPAMERHRTGFVEFHCVLVSRPALEACIPFDEELRSTRDHCDLTLEVGTHGGEIWLEPSVTVAQMLLWDRLPASDRRFYALRWSDAWNRRSLARFREKWDLDPDDPLEAHDLVWLRVHRLDGHRSYGGASGALPRRPRRVAMRVADRGVQSVISLRRSTLQRTASPPRLVHAPAWYQDTARQLSG